MRGDSRHFGSRTRKSPLISPESDYYARLRTFDRNKLLPKGAAKLIPVILVADDKDIGPFLQPIPRGIAGEMHIPVASFPLVPRTAFKFSGIAP